MPAVLRRYLGSAVAWTVGAAVAVGVGVLALSLIGDGLATGSTRPLTSLAAPLAPGVAAPAVSTSSSPSPTTPSLTPPAAGSRPPARPARPPAGNTPSPTRSPSALADADHPGSAPPSVNSTRQFTFNGGMIVVRCLPAGAYLVSWSPAQGFSVRGVHRGPDTDVGVVFGGNHQLVQLGARCVAGVPQPLNGWHNGDDWSGDGGH